MNDYYIFTPDFTGALEYLENLGPELLTDRFAIGNQFNIFFVNIGTKDIVKIVTPLNKSYKNYLTSPCKTSFNFRLVTEDDINIIIISKLNSKMSSGR